MLRTLFCLLLLLCPFLLLSCSLPSTPPQTVNDPAIRALYMQAVEGDANALYRVSCMYAAGSHGFPKDGDYATMALEDAAERKQPQAVHDLALRGVGAARERLNSFYARHASYKDWEALASTLTEAQQGVARAEALGDARAKATLAALGADLARYRELGEMVRGHYEKCPDCRGEGSAYVWREGPRLHGDERGPRGYSEKDTCPRCLGKGFIVR